MSPTTWFFFLYVVGVDLSNKVHVNDEAPLENYLMWGRNPQAPFYLSEMCNDISVAFIINFLGGYGEGEIPDPISNSEVKPSFADGTVRKSMEE